MLKKPVKIITDSTCDIHPSLQEILEIEILPLSVIFGDEAFLDGVEISAAMFYKKLETSVKLPTTSLVSPEAFEKVYKKYLDEGFDIVSIHISSHMSGTCQSALFAKQMLGAENIYVIDSKSATFGLGVLVYEAINKRDKGLSAKELSDELDIVKNNIVLYGMVDTLKYLKMGGRLSSTSAMIGGILNVKPIVTVKDGLLSSIGKARGHKAAFRFMIDKINTDPIDFNYPCSLGHANAPQMLNEFEVALKEKINMGNFFVTNIGAVIGTHSGSGCVGIAYFKKV